MPPPYEPGDLPPLTDTLFPPTWSSRPPTAPGLYRHRGPDGRMRFAAVRADAGGRLLARFADAEPWADEAGGHWSGPLGGR